MVILTDHSGNIITSAANPWLTHGEYTRPDVFRIVVADIPDGREAVRVTSFGESETRTFQTHEGAIVCTYVYADADVETREVDRLCGCRCRDTVEISPKNADQPVEDKDI